MKTLDELMALADEWALDAGNAAIEGESELPLRSDARVALASALSELVADVRRRTLEEAAKIAEDTWEGCCNGTDGDSGYDFMGDHSAEAIRRAARQQEAK